MTITIGQLVSGLFESYGKALKDEELAAVATQVRINELLERASHAPVRRTSRRRAA